jgi:hypothetical protein
VRSASQSPAFRMQSPHGRSPSRAHHLQCRIRRRIHLEHQLLMHLWCKRARKRALFCAYRVAAAVHRTVSACRHRLSRAQHRECVRCYARTLDVPCECYTLKKTSKHEINTSSSLKLWSLSEHGPSSGRCTSHRAPFTLATTDSLQSFFEIA